MKDNHFSLKGSFEEIQEHNSTILVTKMKVFAFGKNLNLSSIDENSFNIARNSIFNIPVVAKFNDGEDIYGKDGELEGHNTRLSTDKNGNLTIIADTFPIGVIGSDATITYEQVNEGTEESPDMKTYVCVDKVYLWKRYDAVQKIQEWMSEGISPKVSMEIGNITGHYSKEQSAYVIESFEFEAVAALGSSVSPCFPMAQIESYSSQTFEEAYYSMLKELKFSLQRDDVVVAEELKETKEGGNKIVPEEISALLQKYSLTENDLTEKGIAYTEFSIEDLETKINETFQVEEEVETEEVTKTNFSLTSEQLEDELRRELAEIETITEDWWGEVYKYPRYSYVDNKLDQNIVVARDCVNRYLCGFSFVVTNDNVEIDANSMARYKIDYNPMNLSGDTDPENGESGLDMIFQDVVDYQLKRKEVEMKKEFASEKETLLAKMEEKDNAILDWNEKFSKLDEVIASKDETISSLQQFKKQIEDAQRKEKVEELFSKFSKVLSKEDMEELRSKESQFESFDAFAKEFKSYAADKLVENHKEVKPEFSSMAIPTTETNDNKPVSEQSKDVWSRLSNKK